MRSVTIPWDGGTVTGRLAAAKDPGRPGVLLAHGAGTNQDHAMVVALRDGLAAAGFPVLTFNYPYTEAGKKRPDAPKKLLACHRSAAEWFRAEVDETMVMAGRSMGGRIASMLAADGEPCSGLILFSYPLHPAGRPENLRKDHLPDIAVPVLSILGTRDALATGVLYDRWVRPLPNFTTHEVGDGDHSFRVRKASGRSNEEALAEVIEAATDWLGRLL
ncbi:MAG: dienelactone hydrolase family protein [Acidimicrobiia bacterium]|nr:dienelactone hydrolase family protein [Acidimicrobiia bacterium]